MKKLDLKKTETHILVFLLQDISGELEHGRGLNQIQIAIVQSIISASKALNYAVNG